MYVGWVSAYMDAKRLNVENVKDNVLIELCLKSSIKKPVYEPDMQKMHILSLRAQSFEKKSFCNWKWVHTLPQKSSSFFS